MKKIISRGFFLTLLFLCSVSVPAQEYPLQKTTGLPDYEIKMWTDVWRPDIKMFGRWITPLGDINHDGYDDIAVASFADTTFIFLGGEEFSHEPIMFLLGGGGGIAAGDFNRDGRMDLVTAIEGPAHHQGEPDPGYHGKLRFFLGKNAATPFDIIPDLTIRGGAVESLGLIPNSYRSGIAVLDYNGDGYSDLLAVMYGSDTIRNRQVAMYLGGPALDSIPIGYFQVREELRDQQHFADDYMIGDVNGDGCDDIFVQGSYNIPSVPGRIYYWDLHFGNALLWTNKLDRVLSSEAGWAPRKGGLSNLVDINADGNDDIFDAQATEGLGDIQLFLSSSTLPDIIISNDTIPNLERLGLEVPTIISPAGDMNGDGWEDVLVGWSDRLFRYGTIYQLYPGGPSSKYKTPIGVFGILSDEHHLELGAFSIGDVNGDGCDDIAVLGRPSIMTGQVQNRFRIYLGSREMQTAVSNPPSPHSLQITVYPHPVPTTQGYLTVSTSSTDLATVDLILSDMLGRQILQTAVDMTSGEHSTNLPIHDIAPGMYSLIAIQGETRVSQSVIIF